MKKMIVAGFAVICVISSIMAGTGKEGNAIKIKTSYPMLRDTIPGKTDTTRYPKHDTTAMPRLTNKQ